MSPLTPKRTLLIGVAIILAVNAIALGGVAYNRSGKPDSALQLSQRELGEPAAWQRQDESGVSLHIQWRVPVRIADDDNDLQRIAYGGYGREPDWLDANKLAALGFDTRPPLPSTDNTDIYNNHRESRREVFLVLELDGPAYRHSVDQVRQLTATARKEMGQAKAAFLKEEKQSTRLFAVDAGVDADALRAKYPDRAHYAIVRGTIRPRWSRERSVATLSASIDELSVEEINVPRGMQAVFQDADGQVVYSGSGDDEKRAPFAAVVAFGRRQEPWMIRASKGSSDSRQ